MRSLSPPQVPARLGSATEGPGRAGPLLLSLHDVGIDTLAPSRRWLDLLDDRAVACTALVVAGGVGIARPSERVELAALLDRVVAAGGEIQLHGWSHRRDGVPTRRWRRWSGTLVARGCEELWHLDEHDALERLVAGRDVLVALGHEPGGVTPPGWLASAGARRAMRTAGFSHRSDHAGIHGLGDGRRLLTPALSQRPGTSSTTLAAAGVNGVARRLGHRPVRLALHPADLDDPALAEGSLVLVDELLAQGRDPMTYAAALDRLGRSPRRRERRREVRR